MEHRPWRNRQISKAVLMVRPVFRKVSLAGCLLWCAYLPLPSHADSRTTIAAPAIAAYVSGDHAKALRLFRDFAERGDSGAQAMLGTYYVNGELVPKDYAEAMKWFKRSADQGDPIGQYQLGVMYHNGQGVPPNDTEAAKWLRLSAAQGYADARGKLAILDRKRQKPSEKALTDSDAAIVAEIIKASRDEYYATGHPCACPDDITRNGRSCGNMSAYIRPGGAHPLCYPKDVTTVMISDYRSTRGSKR
jgi:Sel1 repeat